MSHTIREKTKLLNRVRRIRGQVEAVERALGQEIGCADVLQLITGARGAIDGLMGEVIEDHIRMHLLDPALQPDSETGRAAEELIDVVRCYQVRLNNSWVEMTGRLSPVRFCGKFRWIFEQGNGPA